MSIKQAAKRGFCRFRNWWVYGAPTHWLDMILVCGLWGAAIMFATHHSSLLIQSQYVEFNQVPIVLLVGLPLLAGMFLACSMRGSDFSVGFARLCAGTVWTLGFAAYVQTYPPLDLNIFLSGLLSFFAWLAGVQQIQMSLRRERCEMLAKQARKAANECARKSSY